MPDDCDGSSLVLSMLRAVMSIGELVW